LKNRKNDRDKKLQKCHATHKVVNTFLKCYTECGSLNFTALRNDGFIKNVTYIDQTRWEAPNKDKGVNDDDHLVQYGQHKMVGDPRNDPYAA